MRRIKYIVCLISMTFVFAACMGNKGNNADADTTAQQTTEDANNSNKEAEAQIISQRLCNEFPKELVLKYNPDATHIDIERVDNGSGGILHCNVKLFYGKKEYEFWKGQVSASINQMKDPFWQYNPDKNPTLYHKIEGLGEKSVYISNMYQLLILKEGVLYSITPPNSGSRTSSGKETKEIALEIAKQYNL